MAEVMMIACDNPSCDSVGTPEYVPWIEQNRRQRKSDKITGPYGWHQGDGWLVGSGPNYSYFACRTQCVEAAIAAKIQQFYDLENEMYQ